MTFEQTQAYVDTLNAQKFAGYSDWRLPTLQEAMSLMEPTPKNGSLFIDSVFDGTQKWIWTSDKEAASRAWFVDFNNGFCLHDDIVFNIVVVRAVR